MKRVAGAGLRAELALPEQAAQAAAAAAQTEAEEALRVAAALRAELRARRDSDIPALAVRATFEMSRRAFV